ncbi:MAG: MOP flippase family protein [Halobacteriota archaeon]
MTLKTRTIRGIGWSATSQIARLLMQILISAILARLLTPSEFGLIAMITVFSSFVAVFSSFGLVGAIIQKKDVSDEALSSIFWLGVGLGALLTIALAASAPLIAAFYSEPILTPLVVFISTTFFISSFGTVQSALLTKSMNFKALAVISVCAIGISGLIAVFLAFSGYGVWSLAWNVVLSTLITVLFTWIYARWVPRFLLELPHVKGLLGFGANLTGFSFVDYFERYLDNLLIGKFLGPTPLGFYNLAYNLLLFPLSNISDVVGRVMFPALSIVQHDKQLMRETYITANRYVAALSFPLMLWVLVTAPQLVRVIYGPKWISAIPLVQILALTAMEQSIGVNISWIFLSQGKTDVLLKVGIFVTSVVVVSFAIGLRWGVEGVAIAYTIASYLVAYPVFAITFRLIDMKVGYFLAKLRWIVLATLILGIIASLLQISLEKLGVTQDVIVLALVTAASLLIYSALIFVFDKELFTGILRLLGQLRSADTELT